MWATRGATLTFTRALDPAATRFSSLIRHHERGASDYHALQAQYQRAWRQGFQALASYSWAHAIDNVSTSSTSLVFLRGDADFDVRHRASASATYDLPAMGQGFRERRSRAAGRWMASSRPSRGRRSISSPAAIYDPVTLVRVNRRPNLVHPACRCIWTIRRRQEARIVNRAAFTIPAGNAAGDLGRNVVRGFALWQVDLCVAPVSSDDGHHQATAARRGVQRLQSSQLRQSRPDADEFHVRPRHEQLYWDASWVASVRSIRSAGRALCSSPRSWSSGGHDLP